MGIKKKKLGARPKVDLEKWQSLALDPTRQSEARAEYLATHRNVSIVEAHRKITEFAREHKRKWG